MSEVSAIVLCGGRSRRMGGADKTALPLGGTTVLDHLLDELPTDWPVVCVGGERPTRRDVVWTREQPPGGGPVAGIAAGLGCVHTDVVVLVAGDQPFSGPAAAELARVLLGGDLSDAHGGASNPHGGANNTHGGANNPHVGANNPREGADAPEGASGQHADRAGREATPATVEAATALDGEGRRQPLLTAYRAAALRRAIPEPAADTPARHLLRGLRVVEVPQPDQLVDDVDTPAALERARHRARSRGSGPA